MLEGYLLPQCYQASRYLVASVFDSKLTFFALFEAFLANLAVKALNRKGGKVFAKIAKFSWKDARPGR